MILELQPAGDEHVDAFAAVYRASLSQRYPELPRLRDDAALHGYCSTVVREHEAWIGVIGPHSVACLVLGTQWIHHPHVHPDSTGIGIGTRLVELAKYRRADGLEMRVHSEATGARR